MTAIDELIKIAENEVGYLEKNNNKNLWDKIFGAGSGNYTKYWSDIQPSFQGQPWCAVFVTWCFVNAFGGEMTRKLLRHYPYTWCPAMAKFFTLNSNPKRGDIVLFYRKGAFVHTGIVTKVNGDYFETIEGNTSGGSKIVANGGGVFKKSYYNSKLPGTKFVTPDYSIIESEDEPMTTEEKTKFNALVDTVAELTEEIKALQNPMIYNYVDENMPDWAKPAVQWAIDCGILEGDENGLNLDYKDLRSVVRLYRARNK